MRGRLASETESGCEAATAGNGWGDCLGLLVYQKSFIFAAICLCEASVTGLQPDVSKRVT